MNAFIETLNRFGASAFHFAWPMLWQSSVLIVVLFITDFTLRRRVRAAVRYALWLVLLVKLLLPPSLALPTGVTWWLFPATVTINPHPTKFVVRYDTDALSSLPLQPAPAFTPPPRPPMSLAAWTILAWSAISAGLLVWLTVRWRQVVDDVQRAMPVPSWLNELFDETKSSTGLHQTVRLRLTDQAMSPAVCGLFRPVILLPQSLVEKLTSAQLRAVMLHELTHLRRGDVWMNCAQALAQIVYWWHPLLWLANARIRRVREEAVDDAVMLALRDEAETYAPTLLEVAKLAFHRPLASLGLVGILESRSALRQRIERLINFRAPRKAGLTIASVLGILAFAALAIPMGAAPSHVSNLSDATGSPATAGNPPPPVGTDSEMAGPATMTLKIDRPPDADRLKKLLLDAGVKMPPTVYVYSDNGVLLVRGDSEQLALVNSAVLKLNGYLPKGKAGGNPVNRDWLSMTNYVRGDGRKVIYNKLNRIRFDQVSWPDGLPLSEVLRSLSDQTRLRDPDKKGINFTFHTNALAASAATASAGGATTINPTTGLPKATPADVAVDASSINVILTLTDIRLADLLDAIVLAADHPIKYSILDDGIVFSTRVSNSAPLETRTFKVDTNIFLTALQKQTGLQTNVAAAMHRLLSNVGVDMTPPKSIFYNDRMGVLYVHATEQDLDFVEKAVMVLTYTPPPQIHIKARFVELPGKAAADLYLGSHSTSTIYPAADDIPQPTRDTINRPKFIAGAATGPKLFTGIMTDTQFRTALHALQSNPNTESLAEPEVTTLSGRQTQIRVTTTKDITTQYLASSDNSTVVPQYEKVEVGPVLDTVASVLPDGYTIDLTVIPSMTEFLGYDNPPTNSTPVVTSKGAIVNVPNILPRFSVRQAVAHLKLWDGQTVVLGRLPSHDLVSGKEVRAKSNTVDKELLVFVTVTLVDPVGNRLHSDDEISFTQKSIPPQGSSNRP